MKHFKVIDPASQFGHIGCQEAQHTIKSLKSSAIFLDVAKAFDTVHHDLLQQFLTKYGLFPILMPTLQKEQPLSLVKSSDSTPAATQRNF